MKKDFLRVWKFCCFVIAPLIGAQKPTPPPAKIGEVAANTVPPNAAHELTAADADVFLDGLVPALLEHNDVAGAVIMIVKDGKVLYANGYGYSDVKSRKPVSVDDTLFRPGSISKLFTCTAVMQLVEQGKLDLDRDVNDYLDFKIPATYAQPVTLRRIMTHTAGFVEWGKDLFVPTAADLEPIGEVLPNHLPARIFAPGEMPAYSNYAMTIAGYIVQRISGEKFEDYIANHIYKPLGIVHSTFVQPLPTDLKPLMSSGFALASGGAKEFEFVNSAPAGSMSTSAGDIAKFMIAHLQDGRYGDVQILKPETAKLMHSRAFGPVPELNGMALAFFPGKSKRARNHRPRRGHAIFPQSLAPDSGCECGFIYFIEQRWARRCGHSWDSVQESSRSLFSADSAFAAGDCKRCD